VRRQYILRVFWPARDDEEIFNSDVIPSLVDEDAFSSASE
jgi:hypothetical protein